MHTRKRMTKRLIAVLLTFVVALSLMQTLPVQAAPKMTKHAAKSVTMLKGEKIRHFPALMNMISAKSSKPSVVSVKKAKNYVVLTAKKTGTATITIVDEDYPKTERNTYTYKVKVVQPKVEFKYVGTTSNNQMVVSVTNKTGYSFDLSLECTSRDAKGNELFKGPAVVFDVVDGSTAYITMIGKNGVAPDFKKSTIKVKKYYYKPELKYTNVTSKITMTDELDLSQVKYIEATNAYLESHYEGNTILKLQFENPTFDQVDGKADILWYDEEGKLLGVDTQSVRMAAGETWTKEIWYNNSKYIGSTTSVKNHNYYVIVPRFVKEKEYAPDLSISLSGD
ncbi:MAG: hypothetical protein J6C00_02455 [Eubacterium sp.]|nr:hypothetical protein [Eubacterium sp.]